MGVEAKIIDTTDMSIGFPNRDWNTLITRENYLAQIEDFFAGETRIVFLEGDDDIGKTTLCGQFAKKNHKNTISVFFNPHNNLDYGIDYFCANAVPQIKSIIDKPDIKYKNAIITADVYRHFNFELRKILGKGKKVVYLIIDGLGERTKDAEFIKKLFHILPIGVDFYRIIITGPQSEFEKLCPQIKSQEVKNIPLTGFSKEQIIRYLNITKISDSELDDLFNITKGYPGRLKTLKRLLINNSDLIDNITDSTSYKQWIELDCENVQIDDANINIILSLLANTDKSFEIKEIAQICSLTEDKIRELIENLHIIELFGDNLEFISSSHKKYFTTLLRANSKKISDLLIRFYASDERAKSQFELSKIYAENENWSKLMPIINEDYIHNLLEATGSLLNVNESIELGFKASIELKKYPDLLKYSIQGSILNELDNFLFWESEINARISILDFDGAIKLANSAVLKVDQLRLLALIARKQKEFEYKVEEELIEQINELYKLVDLSSVGEKIFDIVADLIYALPNLAIEMIEKSSGTNTEKDINEWVIAKLSLAAIDSNLREKDSPESNKKLQAIQSLSNPSEKKINQAISFLVGNYSSQKVLDEVRKLSDPKERLSLLRLWLNNTRSKINNIEIVIDKALDELIQSSSESTITVDVLKELSSQLPYINDAQIKLKLYHRFKSIEKTINDLGLTKNKYIYKLNIFHTEYTLELPIHIETINNILNEIDILNDPLIQIESYAEVYVKLKSFFVSKSILGKVNFVDNRLLQLSIKLFKETAMQFKVSEHLLRTIAKRDPKQALVICNQINLQVGREQGRLLILESYLDNNLKNVKIELLQSICNSIETDRALFIGHTQILERYSMSNSLHF